ncbi:hypothetical protein SMB34_09050 [Thalassospira permensis NBRC 106175]|uniref:Uncharacterized protein n=1 Tax=Thalassospira permensis NBRC 106175 TaxID=1353532 RepID=A0ABR4TIG7_9PROT|nr:hypothetical protein SMB34_09050 [Thalassospira permensis NBRC 106175]
MHMPGVIETKKAVGIKAPIKDRLTIVYIRKLVAALDTKRYRKIFWGISHRYCNR